MTSKALLRAFLAPFGSARQMIAPIFFPFNCCNIVFLLFCVISFFCSLKLASSFIYKAKMFMPGPPDVTPEQQALMRREATKGFMTFVTIVTAFRLVPWAMEHLGKTLA
ncbi:hypothetical protein BX070DRAFT_35714 [Coemansia spiralis]|nr:hypothetical protein BX070DRAFT_35714 [Coemansia spiralis]